jgi:hypothetical protein
MPSQPRPQQPMPSSQQQLHISGEFYGGGGSVGGGMGDYGYQGGSGFQSSVQRAGGGAIDNGNSSPSFASFAPNPFSASFTPTADQQPSSGPMGSIKPIPSIPTLASLPGLAYGTTFASGNLWGQDNSGASGWGGGPANGAGAKQVFGPPANKSGGPSWQNQGPVQGW